MPSVNIVKLAITPRVMPSDFLFPPPEDAENTMGKSGHMQGAKIVMNPAKNEKIRSVAIYPPVENPGYKVIPPSTKIVVPVI
jgi:hypothetical protein